MSTELLKTPEDWYTQLDINCDIMIKSGIPYRDVIEFKERAKESTGFYNLIDLWVEAYGGSNIIDEKHNLIVLYQELLESKRWDNK